MIREQRPNPLISANDAAPQSRNLFSAPQQSRARKGAVEGSQCVGAATRKRPYVSLTYGSVRGAPGDRHPYRDPNSGFTYFV